LSQSLAASLRAEFGDDDEAMAVAQMFESMKGDEIEDMFRSLC